jgi:hypothetical protein
MSAEIRNYAQQLRRMVEEYYHRQLTLEDYRAQRKLLLDQLERESAGGTDAGEARRTSSLDPAATPS